VASPPPSRDPAGFAPDPTVPIVQPEPALTGQTADNAARFAKLQRFYVQAQRYGKGGIRELDNGRYRFYGQVTPARSSGEMVGRRLVREWDPRSDTARIWHETLDSSGRVRIVRPDVQHTGGKKIHYMFDASGEFVGVF
jgi:hypothetical protein